MQRSIHSRSAGRLLQEGRKRRFSTLGEVLSVLCLGLLAMSASPARAELLLANNGIHFGPGDSLVVSIGLADTAALTQPVDIYFAVIPPGSDSVLFISGEPGNIALTAGSASNPATWVPLARSVQLSAVGDLPLTPYLSTTLGANIPTGDYRFALASTETGTLNLIDSKFTTVRILENSIRANLGTFSGNWLNQTFNVPGTLSITIKETSPGTLEGALKVNGAHWESATGTETRQVPLADFTGLIDYETQDPLLDGTWSLRYTPQGEITISMKNIGFGNYASFEASGAREGNAISISYTVYSPLGKLADGTVTGSRQ